MSGFSGTLALLQGPNVLMPTSRCTLSCCKGAQLRPLGASRDAAGLGRDIPRVTSTLLPAQEAQGKEEREPSKAAMKMSALRTY